MQEFVYLLKVADVEQVLDQVARFLGLTEVPQYVRVATLAPLSTFGYHEGSEGAVLAWTEGGLCMGVPDDLSVPRAFIPWQNISYVADGDLLKDFADFRAIIGNSEVSFEEFRTRTGLTPA